MAMNYGLTDFNRLTIFRPHNVYGPDMGWEHVLPQFVLRMKKLSEDEFMELDGDWQKLTGPTPGFDEEEGPAA